MAAEKRATAERRARVRENDVDAAGAVAVDGAASGADAGDIAHFDAAKRVFQERLL